MLDKEYIDKDTGIITHFHDTIDCVTKKAFLAELSLLSNKYKIIIDGCGCCGSPYLVSIHNYDTIVYEEIDDSIKAKSKIKLGI